MGCAGLQQSHIRLGLGLACTNVNLRIRKDAVDILHNLRETNHDRSIHYKTRDISTIIR